MAEIVGAVTRVQLLPDRPGVDKSKYPDGMYSLSIEGIGLLASGSVFHDGAGGADFKKALPRVGMTIKARVETQWARSGGKPNHWLRQWVEVRAVYEEVQQAFEGA